MARIIGSTRTGAVRAYEVIRMLCRDGRPTRLGAVASGAVPCLVGDVLKAALAMGLLPAAWRVLGNSGGSGR